jgi:DNA-binding transcriptional regulator YiaG
MRISHKIKRNLDFLREVSLNLEDMEKIDQSQDKESISTRLLALREKLDLTQREMSKLFGVALRTWQDWEYANTKPPGSVLVLLNHFEINPPVVSGPAEVCKQLRAKLNLRKKDMADLFDCTATTWGQWERGIRKPQPETFDKIKKKLEEIP